MSITTSYFAVCKHLQGTKVSVARFNHPRMTGSIDEVLSSFAPSAKLLTSYKEGNLTWADYKRKYTIEQRQHYKDKPEDFDNILNRASREDLILLCYEKSEGPKTMCHRMLLVDMLKKVADEKGIKVEFKEEKPYENNKSKTKKKSNY